ncbi:Rtf2 RING-finger-domain-containing protein [Kalaharituber pfeilii]|nr:Rtf2 RING-finger-domain-containing protein [Kalaharituber pfeilii]
MGNDGGSIPTRRELLKSAGRSKTHSELRDSQTQRSQYYWTYCALSKRPLASPIVADHLGRLYNKDAIIEWLLKRLEAFGDGEEVLKGRGVNGLKDIVEVHFHQLESTPEKEHNGNGAAEQTEGSERKERWVCPITCKELGGGVRAVYLVPCGCAFAEGAIKETAAARGREGETTECLQCGKPYNPRDVININPTAEADITRLQTRLKDLSTLGLTHSLKKAAGEKSKKRKLKEKENGTTNGDSSKNNDNVSSNIKNSATASITSKVLADEREKTKLRKLEMSDSVKSLFSAPEANDSKDRSKRRGGDFMTRGYTLPNR